VGASGFAINIGALSVLTALGVPLAVATFLAIETSIMWNFFWNDRWTFNRMHGSRSRRVRLGGYHLAVLAGGVVNYVVVLALAGPLSTLVAGAIGVSIAATINFLINRLGVYGRA
jgi:dolichol-phosphate mannosyltransferase